MIPSYARRLAAPVTLAFALAGCRDEGPSPSDCDDRQPDAAVCTDAASVVHVSMPGQAEASGQPPSSTAPSHAATPGGVLWKTYNSASGVEAYSLDGGPWRSITPRLNALAPTFDGSRYAYASDISNRNIPFEQIPSYNNQTELGVVDTEKRQTLYQAVFTANIYRPRPSPVEPALVLALWEPYELSRMPVDWVIIDLAKQEVVKRFPAAGSAAWLPDGRYLRLLSSGEIYVGSATQEETRTGMLSLPLGTSAGSFTVNPQGTRMAVRVYSSAGSGGGVDVYVADIDGSRLERFTKTGLSSYGVWSPDGRHLAFNYDPDVRCGDNITTTCLHSECEIRFAPESARDVVIERRPEDPPRFTARNAEGRSVYVPCNVFAWTNGPAAVPGSP